MNSFNLSDCGVCSSWSPNVTCKRTCKTLRLSITKCVYDDRNTYKLDSTGLEEGCIEINNPLELEKESMEQYLNENFTLIEDFICTPFSETTVLCPECNKSTEPGLWVD